MKSPQSDTPFSDAEIALSKLDPILGALIQSQTLAAREPRTDYFTALCSSIISQQVSVAAARAIFARFQTATKLRPEIIIAMSEEDIKAVGLSRQKVSYIRDLALHFHDNPNIYNHLDQQSDEDVIQELTDVKGIGTWTAQMFLMFTLGREDVFAPDDAGLQRAMMNLYKWDTLPAKKDLELFASKWQPYRTVASLHLWHSLDNKPLS